MTEPPFDYRKLSIPERLELVEEIWDSIAADAKALPLTPEQRAELARRWAEHERDPGSAIPWEQVRKSCIGAARDVAPSAFPTGSAPRAP